MTFWDWFSENHDNVAAAMASGESEIVSEMSDEIDARLERDFPGVTFVYGSDRDVKEFIASANGDRNAIKSVKSLIASAPELSGWDFIAFRQPSRSTTDVTIGDLKLSTSMVSFQAFNLHDEGLAITLYPDGMVEEKRDQFEVATVLLLDHTIGEYAAMVLIDSLAIAPKSEVVEGSEPMPLNELLQFLVRKRGLK